MGLRLLFLATVMALTAVPSSAADSANRSPEQAYQNEAEEMIAVCSMMFKLSTIIGSNDTPESNWVQCLEDRKKATKGRYEALQKLLRKPAAKAALKEHYIAVVNASKAIEPELNEIKLNYGRRQADHRTNLNDKWTRFELEN